MDSDRPFQNPDPAEGPSPSPWSTALPRRQASSPHGTHPCPGRGGGWAVLGGLWHGPGVDGSQL